MNKVGIENPPITSMAGHVMEKAILAFEIVCLQLARRMNILGLGGFFCVADAVRCEGQFCGEIGTKGAGRKHRAEAEEKIGRLCKGGAELNNGIRAGDLFLAAQGLPEDGNEAVCMLVALSLGKLSPDDVRILAEDRKNTIILALHEGGDLNNIFQKT